MKTEQPELLLSSVIEGHPQLLVAFSGGLDSTVLLHQLCLLRDTRGIGLRAIHVHHGISCFADDWVTHCQQQCQTLAVPLEVVRVSLQNSGQGLEAQAREARYAAFAAALQPGEALVTAQHLNDQCETLLLALKRGSGPAGLAAMPECLPFAGSLMLRPLLHCGRERLESWAQRHHLCWIEDDSNQDDSYDRNFLRLRIVPQLTARWPHFISAAARSARLCGEQEQLLDELLADELAALRGGAGELTIAPLLEVSEPRRAALLRRWLASLGAPMPSRAALQRLWLEVALSREDASPALRFGEYQVRRYRGALWWVRYQPSLREQELPWPQPLQPLRLPENAGILRLAPEGTAVRPARPDEAVSVRFRASGLIHIIGRDRGRSLKKLWQELQVPPWQRDTTPLLFYGEQLICAPGLFVTHAGQPQQQDCWHIAWLKEQTA